MEYHRLDLVDQGVESLEGLADRKDENFVVINLQRNRLTSFEFFGTHPYLTEVHVQHNRIQSFRGLTRQVSLKSLHLQGCPVACHPYYRLMALLTIGFGLEDVDGLPIASHERHVANALGKKAALAVSYGWLLDLHPRANAEYDAIIDALRRLRREEHKRTQNAHLLSVKAVLANLDRMQKRRDYDASAELQSVEQQQIITRLAGRVAQLERMLTVSPPAHCVPLLLSSEGTVRTDGDNRTSFSSDLLSAAKVALMDRISFSRGIQLRHNLRTEQGDFERVYLQIDHSALTAESFLSRERLVQLSLRSLRVRHVRPLTLVAEDSNGCTVEILFDSLPLLHTVYKALFLFSARPVPPLSATTQNELQEMELLRTSSMKVLGPSAVSTSFSMASEVGQSLLWGKSSDRPVDKAQSGTRTPVASGSRIERGASSKAFLPLDNVADIPPLPAAYSRPGVAGRSYSNRSLEVTQESRTAADVTTDSPAAEALSMASHEAADASAAYANDGVPKLLRSDAAEAYTVPQESEKIADSLFNSASSDSVACARDAKGQDCATEETVSVAGDGGSVVRLHDDVLPPAPSSAAQLTGHTEASVPSLVPPWKAQAKPVSATPSESESQKENRSGEATLRRNHSLPSVSAAMRAGGSSQSSPVVAGDRREGGLTCGVDFQVAAPHGNRISTRKVVAAAEVPVRPAVSSRFRALLIDSDSDQ